MGHETKDAYVKRIKAQLDDLEAKIAVIKEQTDGFESTERARFTRLLNEVNAKLNKVESRLIDLQADSKDLWHDLRAEVENAMDELENAIEKTGTKIKPEK